MNNLAVKDESLPAVDMTGSILAVISRAASDPSVDIEKMERLLAMHERLQANQAKAEFDAALAEMQPLLPVISEAGEIKNKFGEVQSTYAFWEDINEAISPILSRYGFALTFRTHSDDKSVAVTGILSRAGHREETSFTLPHDLGPGRNLVQAIASSMSYAKRYTAIALLNITSRGEDDDGKKGGNGPTLTPDEVMEIQANLSAANGDIKLFCQYMNVDSLSSIRKKDYQRALDAIAKKARS